MRLFPKFLGTALPAKPAKPAKPKRLAIEVSRLSQLSQVGLSSNIETTSESHDDVLVVRNALPELALVPSEPCARPACCAVHAAGSQTPDGRYWCWRTGRPGIATLDDDLVGQIRETAARWRREMERLEQRDARMNQWWTKRIAR